MNSYSHSPEIRLGRLSLRQRTHIGTGKARARCPRPGAVLEACRAGLVALSQQRVVDEADREIGAGTEFLSEPVDELV